MFRWKTSDGIVACKYCLRRPQIKSCGRLGQRAVLALDCCPTITPPQCLHETLTCRWLRFRDKKAETMSYRSRPGSWYARKLKSLSVYDNRIIEIPSRWSSLKNKRDKLWCLPLPFRIWFSDRINHFHNMSLWMRFPNRFATREDLCLSARLLSCHRFSAR